jgi:dTDP-4-amino-4,6-dideoxygalactose transaminase
MNSATSGLYAAIGALGLGYGDEVIVSPYTMSACATCALVYGAIPIFADVSLETGSLDPAAVAERLTPRTRAIVVVHQFGIPSEMDGIMALARKHGLLVIEDCAQAHGARYRNRYVGTIGDIGVFSLNVNKTIQVGEGGVCVTNNAELHYRLALIRNHGEAVVGPAGYTDLTNIIGFNYRLTEVAAAMAVEQLRKLDRFNEVRIGYVDYLNQALGRHEFLLPPPPCPHGEGCRECRSTYYVYPLRYRPEVLGVTREDFVKVLNAEGLRFYQGYVQPLYLQPLYQEKKAFKQGYPFSAPANRDIVTNYAAGSCPRAEKLHFEQMLVNEHIRLPHGQEDMADIVEVFSKITTVMRV